MLLLRFLFHGDVSLEQARQKLEFFKLVRPTSRAACVALAKRRMLAHDGKNPPP
jgi:hypothetical protein